MKTTTLVFGVIALLSAIPAPQLCRPSGAPSFFLDQSRGDVLRYASPLPLANFSPRLRRSSSHLDSAGTGVRRSSSHLDSAGTGVRRSSSHLDSSGTGVRRSSSHLDSAGTGVRRFPLFKGEDNFTLVKVADGVYAAIAKPGGLASGNAGIVVGDDGVLMVDTFFTPAAVEDLIATIASETKQPLKYALNTHYHLDHTGGNQVLAARGVPIIAHDKVMEWQTVKNQRFLPTAEELQKRRDAAAKQLSEIPADQADKRAPIERQIRRFDAMMSIKLTNPTVTFASGTVHLHLGKREVVLFTLPGHTGGDVLAYVPDANVVFTGDMGWRKTLPNLVDATVTDWITSLDKILADYPNAKFVPGHGEVATAAEMREFRDYLEDLRTRVKQAIADGLTIEQAKQQLKLPEKYKDFAFQNFAVPNVEHMYKELKGTKL